MMPQSVVWHAGSIYFTEWRWDEVGISSSLHHVRRIGPDSIITTVAGNGAPGSSGDGGPGTPATFRFPDAVAFDSLGNMFVADLYNHRVRMIDRLGMISSVVIPTSPVHTDEISPAGSGFRGDYPDRRAAPYT